MMFKKFRSKSVVYYEYTESEVIPWTSKFLFFPKKINSNWHWLEWSFIRHTPCGLDWRNQLFSNDEFILYKLSNDMTKRLL